MTKLQLKDVTLIAPTGSDLPRTIASIKWCCSLVDFASVKLITHEKPKDLPEYIEFSESSIIMDSYKKYNYYVFNLLTPHIKTSHALLIQYDSSILYPEIWDDDWLQYDYGGAGWPWKSDAYICHDLNDYHVRCGNGGFSIRSRNFTSLPRKYDIPFTEEQGYFNEDGNCAVYNLKRFLELGVNYMPLEEAVKFSFESLIPENADVKKTFGFHKHLHYQEDYDMIIKGFNQ
jgi:hypothetical protein